MAGLSRTTGLMLLGGLLLMGLVWWRGTSDRPASRTAPTLERTEDGYRMRFERHRGTSARGSATLRLDPDTFAVHLRLHGLRQGRRYTVHLHRGTCREGGGGGLQLDPVTGTAAGTGARRTVVPYGDLNPTYDHLIMVHGPDGHHVLCADVPTVNRMKTRGKRAEREHPTRDGRRAAPTSP